MKHRGHSATARYHVIKRRRDAPTGLGVVVWHTCSARCCLDVLNRLDLAPGEHIYTGGGEWGDWVWSYLDEPLESEFRIHCEHCGKVLVDPVEPGLSLFRAHATAGDKQAG